MDMIRCLWMPDVVHCRGLRPARQYVTHHAVTTFQTPSRSPDAQVDDVPVPVTEQPWSASGCANQLATCPLGVEVRVRLKQTHHYHQHAIGPPARISTSPSKHVGSLPNLSMAIAALLLRKLPTWPLSPTCLQLCFIARTTIPLEKVMKLLSDRHEIPILQFTNQAMQTRFLARPAEIDLPSPRRRVFAMS